MTHGQGLFSPSLKLKFAESKSGPCRVVYKCPAGAGHETLLDGFACLGAKRAVEGPRCALQVFSVGQTRMPCYRFAINGELNGKILGREPATRTGRSVIFERKSGSLYGQPLVRLILRELRHGQTPVNEDERRVVLKFAVRSPLHADQLRRENGESRVAMNDDAPGVGNRIIGGLPWQVLRGCRRCCLARAAVSAHANLLPAEAPALTSRWLN